MMKTIYTIILFLGYVFSLLLISTFRNYLTWIIMISIAIVTHLFLQKVKTYKIDYSMPPKKEIKKEYFLYEESEINSMFESKSKLFFPSLIIFLTLLLSIYSLLTYQTISITNMSHFIITHKYHLYFINAFLIAVVLMIISYVIMKYKIDHKKNIDSWWDNYKKYEYKHYVNQIKSIFTDYPDLVENVISDKISYKSAEEIKDKRIEKKIKKELYEQRLEKLKNIYHEDIALLVANDQITETIAKSLNLHIENIETVKSLVEKDLNKHEIEDIYREHYTYEELALSKKMNLPIDLIKMWSSEKISTDELTYIFKKSKEIEDLSTEIDMLINEEINFEDFKDICEENVYEGMSMRLINLIFGEPDNEKTTELKNSIKIIWTYYSSKNTIQHRFTFKNEILTDFEVNR